MIIKNAKAVFENNALNRDLRIENGKITEINEKITPKNGEEIYDAKGSYVLAGFIDTHIHGAVGEGFYLKNSNAQKMLEFEASKGVTTVAPTICMATAEEIKGMVHSILDAKKQTPNGSKIGGFHLEGPFLNFNKKGGMTPDWILKPSASYFNKLYDACEGMLKIMTLAPELDGIETVIDEAVKKGVALSAGHTEATYEEMMRGIDMGITRLTHTFNAMVALNHRNPGVLGAALTDKRVTCEVICDFAHLAPPAVDLIYKLKGSGHFTAISDSDFFAGLPDGVMDSLGRKIDIYDGVAHLEDGTICGSQGTLYTGFRNLYSLGIPVWEISEMMSKTPAKALGIFDKTGSIEVGKTADLVVIDNKTLDIQDVFVDGKKIN